MVVKVDAALADEIGRLLLEGNPVTTVEGVEKLRRVKELNCSNGGFTAAPPWIDGLSSLKTVYLSSNNLTELPASLMNMATLEKVWAFNNNNLRTVAAGRNLTRLEIYDCDITTLPHDLFHHRLETVDISGNKGQLIEQFRSGRPMTI